MSNYPPKPVLLQQALNAASAAKLSTTAHAVLAHLVADSWLKERGWTANVNIAALAARLNVHRATITRAVEELRGIVQYHPGIAMYQRTFVFCEVAAPARRSMLQGRVVQCRAGAQFNAAPARHCSLKDTQKDSTSTSTERTPAQTPQTAPAGVSQDHAAAAEAIRLDMGRDEGVGHPTVPPSAKNASESIVDDLALFARPAWLPAEYAWVSAATIDTLRGLHTTTVYVCAWALEETRQRLRTLSNPTGYFIALIRNPDLDDVKRFADKQAKRRAPKPKPPKPIEETPNHPVGEQLTEDQIRERRLASVKHTNPGMYARLTRKNRKEPPDEPTPVQ